MQRRVSDGMRAAKPGVVRNAPKLDAHFCLETGQDARRQAAYESMQSTWKETSAAPELSVCPELESDGEFEDAMLSWPDDSSDCFETLSNVELAEMDGLAASVEDTEAQAPSGLPTPLLDDGLSDCDLLMLTEPDKASREDVAPPHPGSPGHELTIMPTPRATTRDDLTKQSPVETGGESVPPIARPPFPQRARDRSPILGLAMQPVLRTCFRVGEAVRAGSQAVRSSNDVFLELYARVASSWREPDSVKQHFVFCDLFHDHGPVLSGVYGVWKGVELWDYDSGRFLGQSKHICRCIGKMQRRGGQWQLDVLNIWEASWGDVEHVRGIVSA